MSGYVFQLTTPSTSNTPLFTDVLAYHYFSDPQPTTPLVRIIFFHNTLCISFEYICNTQNKILFGFTACKTQRDPPVMANLHQKPPDPQTHSWHRLPNPLPRVLVNHLPNLLPSPHPRVLASHPNPRRRV